MPFTFCHPAAILPFKNTRLNFAALVIGSMSPDFVYFLQLAPRGHFGHTLPGLFLFCLPASLLMYGIWQMLLRPQLLRQGMLGIRLRASQSQPQDFLLLSILIGALTHLFWDGFTHSDGWALAWLPWLVQPGLNLSGNTLPVYKLLQHVSSLVGLGFLGLSLCKYQPLSKAGHLRDDKQTLIWLLLALLATGISLAWRWPGKNLLAVAGMGIVTWISFGFVALVISALVSKTRRHTE